jgi:peptidoglycan hydrolase CwlO-like protein
MLFNCTETHYCLLTSHRARPLLVWAWLHLLWASRFWQQVLAPASECKNNISVSIWYFTWTVLIVHFSGSTIDYKDMKENISSTESAISYLNTQISNAESAATRLTREKEELQRTVSQLHSAIHVQKEAQARHKTQIREIDQVQGEVLSLQREASSASTSVHDVSAQLLQLKHRLNECAAVLNQVNTDLRVRTSVVDRLVFRNARQRRELGREKAVIQHATEALSNVQSKIPGLLPESNMKFLELKSSPLVNIRAVTSTIPPVTSRTA